MMTNILVVMIKCLAAILAGILAGNGAVYFFNKMPAAWLCDYGEAPSEELKDQYTQRVKSYPWKFIFTMMFVIVNIKLVVDDWQFAVAAFCSLWLLLEIAIADKKYRIIPDQLVILLAVTAFGFISYHNGWQDCFFGGLAGFGIMGFTALLGKMAYRRNTLGGGDIKLFAALGLIMGLRGIFVVFVLTTLLSAGHLISLLVRKKIRRTDTIPMAPYIAVAAAVYLIVLWDYTPMLLLSL
ncbi:A24 family peptidase [Ihubacter sp. mB4P-1]|uniref:prepilin peptidase n=1 Tax=Ihubacter sp. mB4P-1 TaxID=3242370 RepID=UPI00137B574A